MVISRSPCGLAKVLKGLVQKDCSSADAQQGGSSWVLYPSTQRAGAAVEESKKTYCKIIGLCAAEDIKAAYRHAIIKQEDSSPAEVVQKPPFRQATSLWTTEKLLALSCDISSQGVALVQLL